MAVAFDQKSSTSGVNVASITFTHTPVGTPTAIAVLFSLYQTGTVTGITYGGAAVSLAVSGLVTGGVEESSIYGLANPASGAQQVVATFIGGGQYPAIGCVSVTGSDTTTCFSNTASATGTSTAPSVNVTSATGELVVSNLAWDSGSTVSAEGGGQTNMWDVASSNLHSHADYESGAATVTMSDTLSGSVEWRVVAASFKGAGGGGGGITGPLVGLGHLGGGGPLIGGRLVYDRIRDTA